MECLFCPRPLDGSNEHVIPNAIGGRKESKNLICSDCNNRLGNSLDDEFLKAIDFMTLIINPPTRRRSNGQIIRLLDAQGVKYEMTAGGKFRVRYEQVADGKWIGDASDVARAEANAKRAAAAFEAKTGTSASVSTTTGTQQPGPFQFHIELDNFTALRQMLKWAVELLGVHVLTSQESRENVLGLEREFVSSGGSPAMGGYLGRPLVPHMFEGLENYVLIAQSPDGTVYWEASTYGGAIAMAGRTGNIATRFDPIMYRVDSVTGEHATESPSIMVTNDRCCWVAGYESVCQARTNAAVERMSYLMSTRNEVPTIIDECMKQVLPNEGVFTAEHSAALSRCIAERYVDLMRRAGAFDSDSD